MRELCFVDEITQSEDKYLLPGEWDDLTPSQLLFLIGLVNKNSSAEEIKLKMLLYCLHGRVVRSVHSFFRIKIDKKRYDLTAAELHTIAEVFEYLFTGDDKAEIRINPLLCRNPFPVIRIGFIKLYGADDGLTNLKYQDFAELQIAQASAGRNERSMDDFLALLYKRKNGRPAKFWFRRITKKKKVAILWFYMGCTAKLQELFPKVFSGEQSSSSVADGQMRIIDALAKNDVTKKEMVRHADLYEALYTMQIAAEEYEKLMQKE